MRTLSSGRSPGRMTVHAPKGKVGCGEHSDYTDVRDHAARGLVAMSQHGIEQPDVEPTAWRPLQPGEEPPLSLAC
jgi:hypothetical protein